MEMDERIQRAIEQTEVLRLPKQSLATFGATNIYYYLVTELMDSATVVREGRVIAERPRIVTPAYLINLEGFSDRAGRFIEMMAEKYPGEPGIFYRYKNEPGDMNIVSEPLKRVVDKISQRIDDQQDPLSVIVKGLEELWDVSLLKFTYELIKGSVYSNVAEFDRRGLLNMDEAGVPAGARSYIEELFERTKEDQSRAPELIAELRRWGLFPEYQDRFLSLFRKR